MVVFSLMIIGKSGGLLYNREFNPGLQKLSTNLSLELAGTFHGVHALTRSLTPRLPTAPSSFSSAPGAALPNPDLPITGIETLESAFFRLTCFQTLTGTKFLLFTDPATPNVEVLNRGIYERYADFVMKNPFYVAEMPIRVEAFDRSLGSFLKGR